MKRWQRSVIGSAAALILACGGWFGYVHTHMRTIYSVQAGGQTLGNASGPNVVNDYLAAQTDQLNRQHPGVKMVLDHPSIQIHEIRRMNAKADDRAVTARLAPLLTSHAVGTAIQVNGKVVGYVKDKAEADAVLQQVKAQIDPEAGGDASGRQAANQVASDKVSSGQSAPGKREKVSILSAAAQSAGDANVLSQQVLSKKTGFVEPVSEQEQAIDPDQLSNPDALVKKLETGGVKPAAYTVQDGDCISCIAQKFHISEQVIYRNNPWIHNDMIHAGDVLNITEYQPLLSVQTVQTVEQVEDIPYPVDYTDNPKLLKGQVKEISPGRDGERKVKLELTEVNGVLESSHEVDNQVTLAPVPAKYERGTRSVAGLSDAVQRLLGIPYVWGGTTTQGFDCSGFTHYVFAKYGIYLPRTSDEQAQVGTHVAMSNLREGDLVFFHTYGPPGAITHVAIYLGGGDIVGAVTPDVEINRLDDSYYSSRYITARRVLSEAQYRALAN